MRVERRKASGGADRKAADDANDRSQNEKREYERGTA
jgi:hypothetical protein